MGTNEELKPCPACRSDAIVVYESHRGGYYVRCENCEMRGPTKVDDFVAIDAWNAFSAFSGPLRWTAKPPTEPGWYWVCELFNADNDFSVRIENIRRSSVDGRLYASSCGEYEYVEQWFNGPHFWAGPIPSPGPIPQVSSAKRNNRSKNHEQPSNEQPSNERVSIAGQRLAECRASRRRF